MSQVLARKWRPKNFHELVGQEHVTQTLTYALNHHEIHHAYLFTGTRGVGKTTIARIFAKSLNCKTNGISAEPCGQCEHCREIDDGRFPDLMEVDAASKNSADDTRALLNNVAYAPIKGRFKVYLIDEVHMFSTESFNALLKTLEEPPEHVKFILATTEVQKLPATVLSRCIQFQLKNMTPVQIRGQLEKILTAEKRLFEPEALEHIAEAADGSMRDSLSLLDQAIAFGQGEVRTANVSQLLGTVPSEIIRKLFSALADGKAAEIRNTLSELDESAPDYTNLMRRILEALQQITIVQLQAQRSPDEVSPELCVIAQRLPVELVQLWYQIATDSWQILPYQPNLAAACEMTLLRMLALQPVFPLTEINNIQAIPNAYPPADEQPTLAQTADMIRHIHSETAAESETMQNVAINENITANPAVSEDDTQTASVNTEVTETAQNTSKTAVMNNNADSAPQNNSPAAAGKMGTSEALQSSPINADKNSVSTNYVPDTEITAANTDLPEVAHSHVDNFAESIPQNNSQKAAGKTESLESVQNNAVGDDKNSVLTSDISNAETAADIDSSETAHSHIEAAVINTAEPESAPQDNNQTTAVETESSETVQDENKTAVIEHDNPAELLKESITSPVRWHHLMHRLNFADSNTQHVLAENVIPSDFDDGILMLCGDENSNLRFWQNDGWKQSIEQTFSEFLGTEITVIFTETQADNTHFKLRETENKAEQARAEAAFLADPTVQYLQQNFDAQVQEYSIHSLKNKE